MSMWEECKELQNDLVKMRRDLHQIPELGKILPRTQEYILNSHARTLGTTINETMQAIGY